MPAYPPADLVSIVLTGASIAATLFGLGFAVVTYFNWSNIRGRVRREIGRVNDIESAKISRRMDDLVRGYGRYLMAVQNLSDADDFEREAQVVQDEIKELWNFYVYSCEKRVWPIVKRLGNAWSWWQPNLLTDEDSANILKALRSLSMAEANLGWHDPSAISMWRGICYAILREPTAAVERFESIADPRILHRFRGYLDVMWGSCPQPGEVYFERLARAFGLQPPLRSSERDTLARLQHMQYQVGVAQFSQGSWWLGADRETGRPSWVGLVPRSAQGEPGWRVDYQQHYPEGGGGGQSHTVPSIEAGVEFMLDRFVGLVSAPSELRQRWNRDMEPETYEFPDSVE